MTLLHPGSRPQTYSINNRTDPTKNHSESSDSNYVSRLNGALMRTKKRGRRILSCVPAIRGVIDGQPTSSPHKVSKNFPLGNPLYRDHEPWLIIPSRTAVSKFCPGEGAPGSGPLERAELEGGFEW